jgi:hypothetical protein
MAGPDEARLRRYLLDGERIVVSLRRHWVRILEPAATAIAGLAFALWVEATVSPGSALLAKLAWWLWFALLGRLAWYALDWRHDWFVATDKRLVLTYGVLTRRVAMMPLAKVTDMSFVRTIPGRVFGYGKFVLESAGQDQALHEVNYVPDATRTYRAICAEIFGVEDHDRVLVPTADPGDWDGGGDAPDGGGPDDGGPPGPPGPDPGASHSRAIPVHRPASETLYRSEDQVRRDRSADTGPIPYYAPEGS